MCAKPPRMPSDMSSASSRAVGECHANGKVRAPASEHTNWAQIVALYDVLLRIEPSPIVALNRAVAVAMRDGPEAGLAEIERAKADGRWEAAYAGPATIEVPDDLVAALAANPKAKTAFEGLNSQNRYAILLRIHDAKRAETRRKRIAQFVEMLAEGRKLYA